MLWCKLKQRCATIVLQQSVRSSSICRAMGYYVWRAQGQFTTTRRAPESTMTHNIYYYFLHPISNFYIVVGNLLTKLPLEFRAYVRDVPMLLHYSVAVPYLYLWQLRTLLLLGCRVCIFCSAVLVVLILSMACCCLLLFTQCFVVNTSLSLPPVLLVLHLYSKV